MKLNPLLALCSTISAAACSPSKRATTLIPSSAFDSQSTLEQYFSYSYPWGDTHNGAARMSAAYGVAAGGVLTLTSVHTGASDYAYNSGTVYAKQQFAVNAGQRLTFAADFVAPTARGTWPAFWLTATQGWPPQIDMAEWKGDGKISFNTFNTSSQVAATDVAYPGDGAWHHVECDMRDTGNGQDVTSQFYLDGNLVATQTGAGFLGKTFWFIIDFQMEGSSGSPGPTTNSTYQVRNLAVTSS